MLQQERTVIEVGEPRIDILPQETADFFYTTLLSRITELIQEDRKATETPSETSDAEGDNV